MFLVMYVFFGNRVGGKLGRKLCQILDWVFALSRASSHAPLNTYVTPGQVAAPNVFVSLWLVVACTSDD